MPPLRRWRPLIAVVAIWLLCMWLFLSDDGFDPYNRRGASRPGPGRQEPSPYRGGNGDSTEVRWSKLPERYPVSAPRALPTSKPWPEIPRIQKHPAPSEDTAARLTRETRLVAVRDSFQHSWKGYKDHAWLRDEVTPLTGESKDPFGGWAATLVDSLDTLWIMGMRDEFEKAVSACERIDFATTGESSVNVFETTIRYLGGFLAAYELSEMEYPLLLKKAVEVGEMLMCAFDTPNRMPISRWSPSSYMSGKAQVAPRSMLVAEVGSLSLEFTKLSQLTGDMKYYDAVQRISDEFEKGQNTTKLPGMWPVVLDGTGPSFNKDDSFTLGGMSDSLYEYLPKQYLILGGLMEQPRKMYEGFIDVAKKHLFRRALNQQNIPLIISGDVRVSEWNQNTKIATTARGQHLTCFAGGMVGIAARIFSRHDDLDVAAQLTDACVWSYNTTVSGIGPEIFNFVPCGSVEDSQTGENCSYSGEKWRLAIGDYWRPARRGVEQTEEEQRELAERVESIITERRLTPGVVDVSDRKYILRPEAIESVFIMYRITGDPAWMDKAWDMFRHIEMHTRTDVAAASLRDVTVDQPAQVDSMESFWLAETLKYFYLIYSDWETVSLDKWVLNTEAHPLRRPAV